MRLETFNDLFAEQLLDTYDAERQLVEALPKIAEACSHKELDAGHPPAPQGNQGARASY